MINRITLIGRLGKTPEIRFFDNGIAMAKFSLATSDHYQKDGQWVESTEWHNIVVWRELAQRAEKGLKVGYLVFVEGKLTYRKWKDSEGREHNIAEIVADKFRIMSKTDAAPSSHSDLQNPATTQKNIAGHFINSQQSQENAIASDDLPF
jgi:single-strand DNA-binding protein